MDSSNSDRVPISKLHTMGQQLGDGDVCGGRRVCRGNRLAAVRETEQVISACEIVCVGVCVFAYVVVAVVGVRGGEHVRSFACSPLAIQACLLCAPV